jgi:hypothetical protein
LKFTMLDVYSAPNKWHCHVWTIKLIAVN